VRSYFKLKNFMILFNKIITLTKIIIKIKIYISRPSQTKILVYDRVSKRFADAFFPNKSFSFYDVRYESINLYVFFFTLMNCGIKNFKINYKFNYFNFIKPTIVYTSIDNNIGFFKLKKLYPDAFYIADQNGIRDNEFYSQCKKFLKKFPNYNLSVDIFFCFGNNEKKRIKKIISGKIIALGNTTNNNRKYKKISNFKFKYIMFISSLNIQNFKSDVKALKISIDYSSKIGKKIYFLDRGQNNNFQFLKKNFDMTKIEYLENDKSNKEKTAKKLMSRNALAVFSHSTLGLEALSIGVRSACFNKNFHEHYIDKNYPNTGPFWNNNIDKKNLENLLDKVSNYSSKEWKKISQKYSNQLMAYDYNNKKKKKYLKNYL